MLLPIADVAQRIAAGKSLLLAGSETALSALPQGNWIGGTIPYFMDLTGGVCSESRIFVTELPDFVTGVEIHRYTTETLPSICKDGPQNGFTFLIMPAESQVHFAYARDAPRYEDVFLKPVVGWIAGVHLSRVQQESAQTFDGLSGRSSTEFALAMHVSLPLGKLAALDIVNVFHPGEGKTISFSAVGFSAGECFLEGKPGNLAHYMAEAKQDARLPLTADYNGTIVNVSIRKVDLSNGVVRFYAPVFPGVEYKFAAPVPNYIAAFQAAVQNGQKGGIFSCNCILNYLYAELEGKRTGTMIGPFTFGEIAHQLLNQTLVRLSIIEVRKQQR
jgi:hypothetical protein